MNIWSRDFCNISHATNALSDAYTPYRPLVHDNVLNHSLTRPRYGGQENRLGAFRLLVQAGPEGMAAGEVAAALKVPPNTLSFHFDRLRNAGLIKVERRSRSLIYSARYETMNALLAYLTENCCQGAPEQCLAVACSPSTQSQRRKETAA